MAAAFRLLYFPPAISAAARFGHAHLFIPSANPPLLSFSTKPLNSNFHLFLARAQVESQPTTVQFESTDAFVEEEEEEEEEEKVDNSSNARVLIQNLPWTCTADNLRPLLQKYGSVLEIEFSMYNKTRNRGLAFVTMSSHEEAAAAMTNLESTEFEGRVLKLNWANPKKEKPVTSPRPKPMPVHNLFVANLHFQARSKDLREFFIENNANIVSAEVIFNESRQSAGYGFVSFSTKPEAEAALVDFQGKEFMGRKLRVARSRRFLREETKIAIQSESDKGT